MLLRGAPCPSDDALRESYRPAEAYATVEQFSAAVRRSLRAPDAPVAAGWEPAASTGARVVAAAHELLARRPAQLVLVGHGTAWTLLVAALTGCPPDLDSWEAMALPDRCGLDVGGDGRGRLVQPWDG